MQKTISMKKQERNERKKKKLAALATIVELNDKDKYVKAHRARSSSLTESSGQSNSDDNGNNFIKVTYTKSAKSNSKNMEGGESIPTVTSSAPRKQKSKKSSDESPSPKRKKCNSYSEDSQQSDGSTPKKPEKTNESGEITDCQYRDIKRLIRNRKMEKGFGPRIRLRDVGAKALISVPHNERVPIFLTDIQHLLMAALLGKSSPCVPSRWCSIEELNLLHHSAVLLLDGCSLYHYLSSESSFERTNQIFENKMEMVLPPYKPNAMIEDILKVPLTNLQSAELIQKYGSLEAAIEMIKDPTLIVKKLFNIKENDENKTGSEWRTHTLHPEDRFPRTKLLLSALQMVEEGYPLPLSGEFETRCSGFVMTNDKYQPVTNHSPLYGLDCEMCRTVVGVNELTRISIVNEKLETVYETLVRPDNKIVDYLTKYSGITEEIMSPVTKTLKDVQREVKALLPPDAILVGQSLQSDLNAMHMMHPYVIDTSVIFNISGLRRRKSKLQKLALTFLKESIQVNAEGHDSIEDSIATMKLVKLKLANSIEFGDQILADRKRYQDILNACRQRTIQNNLIGCISQIQRTTAIVSATPLDESFKSTLIQYQYKNSLGSQLVSLHEVESNKDAVQKARALISQNNLVIANLRISDDDFRMEKTENTVRQIDKWISKIWKSTDHNGLLVVLMGGTDECQNGLAKIALKSAGKQMALDD